LGAGQGHAARERGGSRGDFFEHFFHVPIPLFELFVFLFSSFAPAGVDAKLKFVRQPAGGRDILV
jgi:hypothetical protein